MSNPIETYFARAGIPYRIVGGQRFFDRKEVKDINSYLAFLFLGFQHSLVAGFFHDLAGEFIQRQRDREVAQLAVHLIEFFQRGGGTLQFGVFPHMADDLQHGHTVFGGQVADLFNVGL